MAKKIIDTTDKPKKKPRLPIKTIAMVLTIVVLVAAGVVAWLYVQQRSTQNSNSSNQAASSSKPVDDLLNGTIEPGSEGAQQQLEASLQNATTDEQKIQALRLLANEAYIKNDFPKAVDYNKQAYALQKDNQLLAQSIADLYLQKLNDNPQALKYYKIAQSIPPAADDADPLQEQTDAYIDKKIKELEAAGVKAAA